jgi:site-specific recombinase XerD
MKGVIDMSQNVNNIVSLPQNSVYSDIKIFLDNKKNKSKNTQLAYENDFKEFFMYSRNKSLESLTQSDLKFTHRDVLKYQNHLVEKYSKSTTVNRKLSSLRSLFKFFKKNDYEVKPAVFEVDNLEESDSETIGVLQVGEAMEMVERAKKMRNGEEKSLIIELAIRTSFRLNSLLSLTWSDFEYSEKDNAFIVSVIGKRKKKHSMPIPTSMFERLLALKRENIEKVFDFSDRMMQKVVKELCKEMNIPDSRNISFHSLKKVAINYILQTTHDVALAAQQGGHSSINTTYKYYIEQNKDYSSMAGMTIGQETDLSSLNALSKEELIALISSCSDRTQFEILSKLK